MLRQNIKDSLLSDHMPFIVKNNEGASYLSWNILYQMKFHPLRNYFNNGFGCTEETEEEYLNRLSQIAVQLGDAVKMENAAFICLQECPRTKASRLHFEEIMKNQLQYYDIFQPPKEKDEYMITISDSRSYTFMSALTQEITNISLEEGMARRTLPLIFSNNVSNKTVLIVNVHANFSKDIQKDVRSFHKAAKEFDINDIILIGDFNRDLIDQSDSYSKHDISENLDDQHLFDGLYVNANPKSSFITDKEKKVFVETRDGAISNFFVNIQCMPHINRVSLNKNISKDLSNIPEEFKDAG